MVPDEPAALLRVWERMFRRSSGARSMKQTPFEGSNFARTDVSWSFAFVSEWNAVALRLASDLEDVAEEETSLVISRIDQNGWRWCYT